ncbi:Retrovirus-related Pol polyprotein type-1 like protein [Argiope bruennichi]|uniref:Retrovirus-related Pol polyprotein type-1 like protein n=1 Tax=Argiope bruennichi TaxID=94029 RepID=A0A8T0FVT4_ARGBR|nr:Retrovirus-related Pol polyprotein type-1 like protein [Argiope bruennichi]
MAAIDVDASLRSLEECFESLENVFKLRWEPSKKLREDAGLLWRRNPNLLLKNLPNEIGDQEVLQLLKEQNPELEEKKELWEETKIRFTLRRFDNSRHLVLEVNPTCRKVCLKMNFLRANWNICKIEDFLVINRCFKCLGYHHKAANCENGLCLFKCAGEHKSSECNLSTQRNPQTHRIYQCSNLFVINEDCGPTFCGSQGSSYIDVTVVGTDLLEDVSCWHLPTYDSLSDHKSLSLSNTGSTSSIKRRRHIGDLIDSCQDPEILHDLTDQLISIIQKYCKMSIPIKKKKMHSVPWWTTEIDCMRKHVNAARRRFQKCKNVTLKEIYKNKYNVLRNKYNLKLLDAKISSWKKFLDEINETNVWKKIYTFGIKQKFQKRVELSGIALPCGTVTNSFEETINAVLSHSFPEDNENDDDDCHKKIRHDALLNTNVANDPPFTIHEIDSVIRKLKLKKSPGPDSIPNEVIKKLHEMHPDLFLKLFNSCLRLKIFPRCWKKARVIRFSKNNDVVIPHLDNLRVYQFYCQLWVNVLKGLIVKQIRLAFAQG